MFSIQNQDQKKFPDFTSVFSSIQISTKTRFSIKKNNNIICSDKRFGHYHPTVHSISVLRILLGKKKFGFGIVLGNQKKTKNKTIVGMFPQVPFNNTALERRILPVKALLYLQNLFVVVLRR